MTAAETLSITALLEKYNDMWPQLKHFKNPLLSIKKGMQVIGSICFDDL
jgi:hypothetical protein